MTLRKRSFRLTYGRRSVAVEAAFWVALEKLAADSGQHLGELVKAVYDANPLANLASSLRVHAVLELKAKSKRTGATIG